jgi:Response regulator containing a CheY-like receiver domain and a GGDEF domain
MDGAMNVRILLVDDDRADLQRTRDALAHWGMGEALRIARGGQEALDYLFGRGQFAMRRRHPLPDLILLDVNMPGTDGFAVLRQVKRAPALRRIPVVLLCTSESERLRAMDFEVRANAIVVKPITADSIASLEEKVRCWTLRLDLPEPPCAATRPSSGRRAPAAHEAGPGYRHHL